VAGVYFALLLVTCVVSAITYDLVAIHHGWITVSEEAYWLNQKYPMVAIILTGVLCFGVGVLVGHLFCPQYVDNSAC